LYVIIVADVVTDWYIGIFETGTTPTRKNLSADDIFNGDGVAASTEIANDNNKENVLIASLLSGNNNSNTEVILPSEATHTQIMANNDENVLIAPSSSLTGGGGGNGSGSNNNNNTELISILEATQQQNITEELNMLLESSCQAPTEIVDYGCEMMKAVDVSACQSMKDMVKGHQFHPVLDDATDSIELFLMDTNRVLLRIIYDANNYIMQTSTSTAASHSNIQATKHVIIAPAI